MKLRNKKTGEIGNLVLNINQNRESYAVLSTENGDTICGNLVLADYDTLAGLNEEWEDYEEPEGWWFIDRAYEPHATNSTLRNLEADREIGNYFKTKEEAEKAVEKLKTWKRLKDKGLELDGWKTWEAVTGKCCMSNIAAHSYYASFTFRSTDRLEKDETVRKDLNLLFGGEE